MKKLMMGNEAIAYGAIDAGVSVVAGYPGTPSTEILETIGKADEAGVYVEWSINEKVALEVGAGAAYTGARVLVTMKQVGLNVASDPLMSLAYIGIKGGMVIVVADDPGPVSSQTEQDTRFFAQYAHVPVFDPTSPEEAYKMMEEAFAFSERYEVPVFFRPTTNICHACGVVERKTVRREKQIEGFVKDSKWVIFPRLSYSNRLKRLDNEQKMMQELSQYRFNEVSGSGTKGLIASGVCYAYTQEVLSGIEEKYKCLKLGVTYPFPEDLIVGFLQGLEEVFIFEELEPVIEKSLLQLCGARGIQVIIRGKLSGDLPRAGEYSSAIIRNCLLGNKAKTGNGVQQGNLPVRPPVLCAGCPHRASFYAVKKACEKLGEEVIFTGDIGCYTLGNAKPLDMVDTCLCMGAGITIAQGLDRARTKQKQIAFIGDSTFFHTGISGIINAVYNQTTLKVVVLDNSTTAMTGHQPHPGTGETMMKEVTSAISIVEVLRGIGVKQVQVVDPFNQDEARHAVEEVLCQEGVSVIVFKAPCIALIKPKKKAIHASKCIGCGKCCKQLGCPALRMEAKVAVIDTSMCYGCGLCESVCPVDAIGGVR